MANIFELPKNLPNREVFESLLESDNYLIERIISRGQTTPIGEWYDQSRDEWVILLQGEAKLAYENGRSIELKPGIMF
jgi:cupin 2 domain-containing protein